MSYKPKDYVESFAEITTFRIPSQISYEIRMVAKQADKEIENSTPNAKIQELITTYEICMKWQPSPESIKFLEDLKRLIGDSDE